MSGRSTIPGAPELPRGFFYRIRRNSAGPLVQIRRELPIGSVFVASSYILPEFHLDQKAAVVAACKRAHDKFDSRRSKVAAEADLLDHYRGDYRGDGA